MKPIRQSAHQLPTKLETHLPQLVLAEILQFQQID
jgi:hypothetical protein